VAAKDSTGQPPEPPRPRWAWGSGEAGATPPAAPAGAEEAPASAEAGPSNLELLGRLAGPSPATTEGLPDGPTSPSSLSSLTPEPASAPAPSTPGDGPAVSAPVDIPAPAAPPPPAVPSTGARPSWSWGTGSPPPPPLPAPLTPVPPAGAGAGAVSLPPAAPPASTAAPLTPARAGGGTALQVQQVLVMSVLVVGWAVALSRPGAEVVLPVLAVVLAAAALAPRLSLPRLLATRLVAPLTQGVTTAAPGDAAATRLDLLLDTVLLAAASLCVLAGTPVAAWTLAWVVIGLTLLEFTFDISAGGLVLGWRQASAARRD
jgi:Domain of unknown function (DUF4395)